jgi:simple sugar transport system ATP-binding protein/ribose transport system ATP-binding protein
LKALPAEPLVEFRGIAKSFGPVYVLSDIDLGIARGSVHGLVGENGAGKSTLGKILGGVHRPSAGELLVDGEPVTYSTPHDALKDGLTMVAQELCLVPNRSVMENVLLGAEDRQLGLLRPGAMRKRFADLEARIGFGLAANAPVGSLRLAEQQKVEILRAIAREARLIVMDEPTASLNDEDSRRLLEIIRRLRAEGTTFIYVSHNLAEVLEICDRVTILRDGRQVRTAESGEETPDSLVTGMIGRALSATFPHKPRLSRGAAKVLEVEGLTGGMVRNVNLSVRGGEIVGLAGLVGSGRSEIAHAIFGSDRRSRGTVRIDGTEVRPNSPRSAIRAGIGMVPESRKDQGLVLGRPLGENVTLAALPDFATAGVVRRSLERRGAISMLDEVGLRGGTAKTPALNLSGGNQQKVLFGKWLFCRPRLLIADEPTRGVDIGAKRAIYDLIVSLAARGAAILLISSELEEVFGLAHRVLVVRGGEVVGELDGGEADEEMLLRLAFGTSGAGPADAGPPLS